MVWCRNWTICPHWTINKTYSIAKSCSGVGYRSLDYNSVDPPAIHHVNSEPGRKSQHYTDHIATSQSTVVLKPSVELKGLSSARWGRCAPTSCCALMVSVWTAAACVHQAKSWTKTKRYQHTLQSDPKHVHQPGCWSQTHEFMTFRVKLVAQRGVQWSVCY